MVTAAPSEVITVGTVSELAAASAVRDFLEHSEIRLAFGGKLGAGKTTMCEAISAAPYRDKGNLTIINHADGIKEEVLEWVSDARRRGYIPGHNSTFEHFCNFLGISPGIVKLDMYELMHPLWTAFDQLLTAVYDEQIPVLPFASIPSGQELTRKVAFVDHHKQTFRTALQLWGQTTKDLNADPYHWVNQTVSRAIGSAPCLNGDTRFPEEMELMRATGWVAIYIAISEETQRIRRPNATPEQLNHVSETSLRPEDCDVTVDGNVTVPEVLLQIASYFAGRRLRKVS